MSLPTTPKKKSKRTHPTIPDDPNIILIRGIHATYGWMGNMSRHPIKYDGLQGRLIEYRTSEHLFQTLRFPNYPKIQDAINANNHPWFGAKNTARNNKDRLEDVPPRLKWDEHENDKDRMSLCLKLKMEQYPELKKELLGTGKRRIIEDCTSRDRESARFWGAVYDGPTGKWIGENVLGVMWMELRADLRRNSKKISRTVGTEKNILEENEPRVDAAPSTPEFIMSNKLTFLTDKYHATEASLAALKEEILAEVLKSTAPANLSTTVTTLHAVPVEQPIKKTKAAGKRGKIGKLPELYYPSLFTDIPVSVPYLVKELNVKNANATSFLRTQVKKGLLKNTKGKYTLTDKGEGFKATLSGGSAPVATAAATARETNAAPKAKGTRNDVTGILSKILLAGGDFKPKELVARSGLPKTSVSAWLNTEKNKEGGIVTWNEEAGTYSAASSTPAAKAPARAKAKAKAKPKAGKAKVSKKKA